VLEWRFAAENQFRPRGSVRRIVVLRRRDHCGVPAGVLNASFERTAVIRGPSDRRVKGRTDRTLQPYFSAIDTWFSDERFRNID
jgi:hypothetical protein